jgi:hypothetical protein
LVQKLSLCLLAAASSCRIARRFGGAEKIVSNARYCLRALAPYSHLMVKHRKSAVPVGNLRNHEQLVALTHEELSQRTRLRLWADWENTRRISERAHLLFRRCPGKFKGTAGVNGCYTDARGWSSSQTYFTSGPKRDTHCLIFNISPN